MEKDMVSKFKALMAQKDSTSNFVALFLLLQILEKVPSAADTCWSSVEPAFLDKLILARSTGNTSDGEAADLRAMGSSILQAFSSFSSVVCTQSFIRRSSSIVAALTTTRVESVPEVSEQLWQVLHTIASVKDGAISILTGDKFLSLANVIFSQEVKVGMSILTLVMLEAIISEAGIADVFKDRVLAVLELASAAIHQRTAIYPESIVLLRCTYSAMPQAQISLYIDDKTTSSLATGFSSIMLKPQKGVDHGEELILLATLLRSTDRMSLLGISEDDQLKDEQKQFFLLVCTLSSAEIRSSLAGMIGKANDENYAKEAQKVAACLDIVRRICLYLVTTDRLPLAADDILKIRDNFSAAFGETISYLRDRWDHSPLCATAAWHEQTAMTRSWTVDETLQDPVLISSTQSLCLWLQEDESLHSDACGLMDIFLGLLRSDTEAEVDYGSWTIPAIHALVDSEKGREQFAFFNGYNVVRGRLETLDRRISKPDSDTVPMAVLQDASVDLELLRSIDPRKTEKWENSHKSLVGRIEMAAA